MKICYTTNTSRAERVRLYHRSEGKFLNLVRFALEATKLARSACSDKVASRRFASPTICTKSLQSLPAKPDPLRWSLT